jgi:stress-induced morphogen
MSFLDLENFIKTQIPDAEVAISDMTGTRDHLDINIKSAIFKGKSLIEQHRMVMDVLKEKLKNEIHAVKLKTTAK